MERDKTFNDMQLVKRRLFAMRNGVVADALRKGGSQHKIIFGVNLPQLVEIAADTGKDASLARRLWQNVTTRESMLLAPMLMPVDECDADEAAAWIAGVPSAEVADVLCHRLLRHLPYARALVDRFSVSEDDLERYTALRLMCNIRRTDPEAAAALGRAELARHCPLTAAVARQLASDSI